MAFGVGAHPGWRSSAARTSLRFGSRWMVFLWLSGSVLIQGGVRPPLEPRFASVLAGWCSFGFRGRCSSRVAFVRRSNLASLRFSLDGVPLAFGVGAHPGWLSSAARTSLRFGSRWMVFLWLSGSVLIQGGVRPPLEPRFASVLAGWCSFGFRGRCSSRVAFVRRSNLASLRFSLDGVPLAFGVGAHPGWLSSAARTSLRFGSRWMVFLWLSGSVLIQGGVRPPLEPRFASVLAGWCSFGFRGRCSSRVAFVRRSNLASLRFSLDGVPLAFGVGAHPGWRSSAARTSLRFGSRWMVFLWLSGSVRPSVFWAILGHFGPKIFGSPEIFFWAEKSPKPDSIAICSPVFVFEMSEKNIFSATLVTTKVAPAPPKACPQAKNPDFILCGVSLRQLLGAFSGP